MFTPEMLDIKAKANLAPNQDDEIVLQIRNLTPNALRLSERELELQTAIPLESHTNEPRRYLRVRGLSPRWLAGHEPPVAIDIAAGKSNELVLNWREWFHHGYWSSLDNEAAAAPALPPPADGQLLVRVCVGKASTTPVRVKLPASNSSKLPIDGKETPK